jgi:hypothetical protein
LGSRQFMDLLSLELHIFGVFEALPKFAQRTVVASRVLKTTVMCVVRAEGVFSIGDRNLAGEFRGSGNVLCILYRGQTCDGGLRSSIVTLLQMKGTYVGQRTPRRERADQCG